MFYVFKCNIWCLSIGLGWFSDWAYKWQKSWWWEKSNWGRSEKRRNDEYEDFEEVEYTNKKVKWSSVWVGDTDWWWNKYYIERGKDWRDYLVLKLPSTTYKPKRYIWYYTEENGKKIFVVTKKDNHQFRVLDAWWINRHSLDFLNDDDLVQVNDLVSGKVVYATKKDILEHWQHQWHLASSYELQIFLEKSKWQALEYNVW